MSFALTSHMTLQAAIRQYFVDCDAPVGLTLYGSNIDGVYGLRRSDQFTFASLALRARKKWNIEC
jgi:hypothetical protein